MTTSPRRRRRWVLVAFGILTGVAFRVMLLRADAPPVDHPLPSWFALTGQYDEEIPDDMVLREDLQRAIDLRRREHFDRVLDARDPGELIEHATLTEQCSSGARSGSTRCSSSATSSSATRFAPRTAGDSGGADRGAPSTSRRACAACTTARRADPTRSGASAVIRRAAPTAPARRRRTRSCAATASGSAAPISGTRRTLLGLGPIAVLAREMSAELQAEAAETSANGADGRADASSRRSTAKGVSFGRVAADPDGTLDRSRRRGRRSRSHGPSVRLEGTSGHAPRHGRGVAPHPSGAALEAHPLGGARRHARRGAVRQGSVVRPRPGRRRARDRLGDADDRRRLPGAARGAGHASAARSRAARRVRRRARALRGDRLRRLSRADARARRPEARRARRRRPGRRGPFIVDVAKDGDGPKIEPKYAGLDDVVPRAPLQRSEAPRHGRRAREPGPAGDDPGRACS